MDRTQYVWQVHSFGAVVWYARVGLCWIGAGVCVVNVYATARYADCDGALWGENGRSAARGADANV